MQKRSKSMPGTPHIPRLGQSPPTSKVRQDTTVFHSQEESPRLTPPDESAKEHKLPPRSQDSVKILDADTNSLENKTRRDSNSSSACNPFKPLPSFPPIKGCLTSKESGLTNETLTLQREASGKKEIKAIEQTLENIRLTLIDDQDNSTSFLGKSSFYSNSVKPDISPISALNVPAGNAEKFFRAVKIMEATSISSHESAVGTNTFAQIFSSTLQNIINEDFWTNRRSFFGLDPSGRTTIESLCKEKTNLVSRIISELDVFSETKTMVSDLNHLHHQCQTSLLSDSEKDKALNSCMKIVIRLSTYLIDQIGPKTTLLIPVDILAFDSAPGHATLLSVSYKESSEGGQLFLRWFDPNGHISVADMQMRDQSERKDPHNSEAQTYSFEDKSSSSKHTSRNNKSLVEMNGTAFIQRVTPRRPLSFEFQPAPVNTYAFDESKLSFLLCPSSMNHKLTTQEIRQSIKRSLERLGVTNIPRDQRHQNPQHTGDCEKKCLLNYLSYELPEPIFRLVRSLLIEKALVTSLEENSDVWRDSSLALPKEQVKKLLRSYSKRPQELDDKSLDIAFGDDTDGKRRVAKKELFYRESRLALRIQVQNLLKIKSEKAQQKLLISLRSLS